jgi:PASTA domain
MSRRSTRFRAPALLIAALTALLVLAAAASAETRTGESTSAIYMEGTTSPEATLTKASASYESTGGEVSFGITTAAGPLAENEHSEAEISTALYTVASECSLAGLEREGASNPFLLMGSRYAQPTTAEGLFAAGPGIPPVALPGAKTVSGTTTTLSTTSGAIAGKNFNCATVEVSEGHTSRVMLFPIVAPVIPPALPPEAPAPAPVPTSTPAKAKCVAPKLVGKKLNAAKKSIKAADCKLGKVTKKNGATSKTGKVAKQSPKVGASKAAGAKIDITLG